MGLARHNEAKLLMQLQAPYIPVVIIQRVICRDSVIIVIVGEDGSGFWSLTPFN